MSDHGAAKSSQTRVRSNFSAQNPWDDRFQMRLKFEHGVVVLQNECGVLSLDESDVHKLRDLSHKRELRRINMTLTISDSSSIAKGAV